MNKTKGSKGSNLILDSLSLALLQNDAGLTKTWSLYIGISSISTINCWFWNFNLNLSKSLQATPSDPPPSRIFCWIFLNQFLFTEVEAFLFLFFNLDIFFVYVWLFQSFISLSDCLRSHQSSANKYFSWKRLRGKMNLRWRGLLLMFVELNIFCFIFVIYFVFFISLSILLLITSISMVEWHDTDMSKTLQYKKHCKDLLSELILRSNQETYNGNPQLSQAHYSKTYKLALVSCWFMGECSSKKLSSPGPSPCPNRPPSRIKVPQKRKKEGFGLTLKSHEPVSEVSVRCPKFRNYDVSASTKQKRGVISQK